MVEGMGTILQANSWLALWHPETLALVLLLAALYVAATRALARDLSRPTPTIGQTTAFVAALAGMYVAMGTPLDIVANQYLFTAHTIQGLLLTMLVPPLIIKGIPPWVWDTAFGVRTVRRIFRVLLDPAIAILLFNGVFTALLVPPILDASLRVGWLHIAVQAILILTALWMWWPVLSPSAVLPRLSPGWRMLYLFFNTDLMMPVTVYVPITRAAFYAPYNTAAPIFGMSALVDQQLGGILMSAVMIVAYGFAFFTALAKNDNSVWYE